MAVRILPIPLENSEHHRYTYGEGGVGNEGFMLLHQDQMGWAGFHGVNEMDMTEPIGRMRSHMESVGNTIYMLWPIEG